VWCAGTQGERESVCACSLLLSCGGYYYYYSVLTLLWCANTTVVC